MPSFELSEIRPDFARMLQHVCWWGAIEAIHIGAPNTKSNRILILRIDSEREKGATHKFAWRMRPLCRVSRLYIMRILALAVPCALFATNYSCKIVLLNWAMRARVRLSIAVHKFLGKVFLRIAAIRILCTYAFYRFLAQRLFRSPDSSSNSSNCRQ